MSGNQYFFSDPHFNHANIIKYCNRPFSSVEEMNTVIIDNINAVVGPGDILWCLGDWVFGRNKAENAKKFLERITCGTVNLIWGNHDKKRDMRGLFNQEHDMYTVRVQDRGEKQSIVLCHYAMRIWNKSHHGVWHLYGHSHGTLPDDPNSMSFDVGVDCHDYKPLSFDDIKKIMSQKQFQPIDHHNASTT